MVTSLPTIELSKAADVWKVMPVLSTLFSIIQIIITVEYDYALKKLILLNGNTIDDRTFTSLVSSQVSACVLPLPFQRLPCLVYAAEDLACRHLLQLHQAISRLIFVRLRYVPCTFGIVRLDL